MHNLKVIGQQGWYDPKTGETGTITTKGSYYPTDKWAIGTKHGPLQSDGCDYLCPDCGGYGFVSGRMTTWFVSGRMMTSLLKEQLFCQYCNGIGSIPLDDKRVVNSKPTLELDGGRAIDI